MQDIVVNVHSTPVYLLFRCPFMRSVPRSLPGPKRSEAGNSSSAGSAVSHGDGPCPGGASWPSDPTRADCHTGLFCTPSPGLLFTGLSGVAASA